MSQNETSSAICHAATGVTESARPVPHFIPAWYDELSVTIERLAARVWEAEEVKDVLPEIDSLASLAKEDPRGASALASIADDGECYDVWKHVERHMEAIRPADIPLFFTDDPEPATWRDADVTPAISELYDRDKMTWLEVEVLRNMGGGRFTLGALVDLGVHWLLTETGLLCMSHVRKIPLHVVPGLRDDWYGQHSTVVDGLLNILARFPSVDGVEEELVDTVMRNLDEDSECLADIALSGLLKLDNPRLSTLKAFRKTIDAGRLDPNDLKVSVRNLVTR